MAIETEESTMKEATITRVFDAPRDEVWDAFTNPERFAAWFGTPPYATDPATVTIDLRPGGEFRATMRHEFDGSELPFLGTYLEVEPESKIVQTLDDPEGGPQHETLTYTFAEAGEGRTEATYHQVGHLPDEQYPLIEQGVNGFFDRLEAQLAG